MNELALFAGAGGGILGGGNSLDGAPSVLLKLMPTAGQSSWQGSGMESLNHSPYGMTLRRSTGTRGAGSLMWYRGDSPVRTYLPPDEVEE